MTFICKHFNDLSLEQLYAIMVLRQEIFVVEQNCPYIDADGKDQESHHLMGFDQTGQLMAYTRLVPKEISYANYVSIGRVVTSSKIRGKGMGKRLMEESIIRCQQIFGDEPVKISAQCHLDKFYSSLGFQSVGEPYLEDDIPHIGMVLNK